MSIPPTTSATPRRRIPGGAFGGAILLVVVVACVGSLPWALSAPAGGAHATPRYNNGTTTAARLPPCWARPDDADARRLNQLVPAERVREIAAGGGVPEVDAPNATSGPVADELRRAWPRFWLGTDVLGRSLLVRCLSGGGVSLAVGLAAAIMSVVIGTLYGTIAGYAGGRIDALMMRIVDVLYGLPYVLLVVLIAVAADAILDEWVSRQRERSAWVVSHARDVAREHGDPTDNRSVRAALDRDPQLRASFERAAADVIPPREVSENARRALDAAKLLIAIGGVSWLTMARVIRGQVLSLKAQPFIEAARSLGYSRPRIFLRHLAPNLLAPIVVAATLTVPQAILQESFLSFLGIGVQPPLPSWGNLAADGLVELNRYRSHWWLLLFPCALLAITLIALNFVGEAIRDRLDPRRTLR